MELIDGEVTLRLIGLGADGVTQRNVTVTMLALPCDSDSPPASCGMQSNTLPTSCGSFITTFIHDLDSLEFLNVTADIVAVTISSFVNAKAPKFTFTFPFSATNGQLQSFISGFHTASSKTTSICVNSDERRSRRSRREVNSPESQYLVDLSIAEDQLEFWQSAARPSGAQLLSTSQAGNDTHNELYTVPATDAQYATSNIGMPAISASGLKPVWRVTFDAPAVVHRVELSIPTVYMDEHPAHYAEVFDIVLYNSADLPLRSTRVFGQRTHIWANVDATQAAYLEIQGVSDRAVQLALDRVRVIGGFERDCLPLVSFDLAYLANDIRLAGEVVHVSNASLGASVLASSPQNYLVYSVLSDWHPASTSSLPQLNSAAIAQLDITNSDNQQRVVTDASFESALDDLVASWLNGDLANNGLALRLDLDQVGKASFDRDEFTLSFNLRRFLWRNTSLSDCSARCGAGVRHAIIQCYERTHSDNGQPQYIVVDDSFCRSSTRPPATVACDAFDCDYEYRQLCGDCLCTETSCQFSEARQSTLQCLHNTGSSGSEVPVSVSLCEKHGLQMPNSTTCPSCNCTSGCELKWEVSTWSSCEPACGAGTRTRNITCTRRDPSHPPHFWPTATPSECARLSDPPSALESCYSRDGCSNGDVNTGLDPSAAVWPILAETRILELNSTISRVESLIQLGEPHLSAELLVAQIARDTLSARFESQVVDSRTSMDLAKLSVELEVVDLQNELSASHTRQESDLPTKTVALEQLELDARMASARATINMPGSGVTSYKNIGMLGFGYHIFKGNPLPSSGVDPGFTLPVLKVDYSMRRMTADGSTMLPDRVAVIPYASAQFDSRSHLVTTSSEYAESLEVDVSIETSFSFSALVEGGGAKFSASNDYKQASEMHQSSESVSITTIGTVLTYVAEFLDDTPPLADHVIEMFNALPPPACCDGLVLPSHAGVSKDRSACTAIHANCGDLYLRFLEKVGTHTLIGVHMGGKSIRVYTMAQTEFESSVEQSDAFKSSLSLSSSGIESSSIDTSLSINKQSSLKQAVKDRTESRRETFMGGDPTAGTNDPEDPTNMDGDKEWSTTVSKNPVPIKYKLVPVLQVLAVARLSNGTNQELVGLKLDLLTRFYLQVCASTPGADCEVPAKADEVGVHFGDYVTLSQVISASNHMVMAEDPKQGRLIARQVPASNEDVADTHMDIVNLPDGVVCSSCGDSSRYFNGEACTMCKNPHTTCAPVQHESWSEVIQSANRASDKGPAGIYQPMWTARSNPENAFVRRGGDHDDNWYIFQRWGCYSAQHPDFFTGWRAYGASSFRKQPVVDVGLERLRIISPSSVTTGISSPVTYGRLFMLATSSGLVVRSLQRDWFDIKATNEQLSTLPLRFRFVSRTAATGTVVHYGDNVAIEEVIVTGQLSPSDQAALLQRTRFQRMEPHYLTINSGNGLVPISQNMTVRSRMLTEIGDLEWTVHLSRNPTSTSLSSVTPLLSYSRQGDDVLSRTLLFSATVDLLESAGVDDLNTLQARLTFNDPVTRDSPIAQYPGRDRLSTITDDAFLTRLDFVVQLLRPTTAGLALHLASSSDAILTSGNAGIAREVKISSVRISTRGRSSTAYQFVIKLAEPAHDGDVLSVSLSSPELVKSTSQGVSVAPADNQALSELVLPVRFQLSNNSSIVFHSTSSNGAETTVPLTFSTGVVNAERDFPSVSDFVVTDSSSPARLLTIVSAQCQVMNGTGNALVLDSVRHEADVQSGCVHVLVGVATSDRMHLTLPLYIDVVQARIRAAQRVEYAERRRVAFYDE
ncbi:hypothetical protein CAOG_004284 [Capsaspora owczarzaki ATCC 30864]|uniref:MACPF domain-containing protein n=2 Tax=Capsaspora owczarzaki (strain ATCC 30864) TaxID=595528 RepID=A0A0D2VRJ6_CAPO3|nr:hypothetical protein CAOG_004284 [Capsaspora owczarzaki ATCC 30864]